MFTKFWGWVKGWFTKESANAVVDLIDRLSLIVDSALPIVEEIDQHLKPAIKKAQSGECVTPVACLVSEFLRGLGYLGDETHQLAVNLAGMPRADLLANVALWILRQRFPATESVSHLRAAIELAYNIYKAAQKS